MLTATTPFLAEQDKLGPLDSRLVDVESLPWRATPTPGVDIKVLVQDDKTGLLTAIFRWAPGSVLDLHEHIEIEQSYVLEGEFEDDDGVYTKGNFAWRPPGHRHVARSPKGAVVLCFFLKPNRFLEGPLAGQELK